MNRCFKRGAEQEGLATCAGLCEGKGEGGSINLDSGCARVGSLVRYGRENEASDWSEQGECPLGLRAENGKSGLREEGRGEKG